MKEGEPNKAKRNPPFVIHHPSSMQKHMLVVWCQRGEEEGKHDTCTSKRESRSKALNRQHISKMNENLTHSKKVGVLKNSIRCNNKFYLLAKY